jgi:hypothetical protein
MEDRTGTDLRKRRAVKVQLEIQSRDGTDWSEVLDTTAKNNGTRVMIPMRELRKLAAKWGVAELLGDRTDFSVKQAYEAEIIGSRIRVGGVEKRWCNIAENFV